MTFVRIALVLPFLFGRWMTEDLIFWCHLIGVLRLLRILRAARYTDMAQLLIRTVVKSAQALSMVILIIVLTCIFLATIVYFTDQLPPNVLAQQRLDSGRMFGLKSIPDGIYWAVTTICTIGYGDIVPKSTLGKMVASFAAWSGVICLSLPVDTITIVSAGHSLLTHQIDRFR